MAQVAVLPSFCIGWCQTPPVNKRVPTESNRELVFFVFYHRPPAALRMFGIIQVKSSLHHRHAATRWITQTPSCERLK